ncbi:hypothetical protein BR63_18045 [Thermanaerosceptrum fracticalcis]|uniref:Uncharacterized protein n=1 Tax=Thermanaerosceptrum fracticalcis TaxID=1712410 RepID=A0A7G6E7E0_THEFR|nr:hypothetical protein [Thermanaerosceptrum fracticalcis]QNB47994.1 hypothetical protein BR63_18045 [Thermanaerosceptrum fracticalcis]
MSSFPPNLDMAKFHLAISTYWQIFIEVQFYNARNLAESILRITQNYLPTGR